MIHGMGAAGLERILGVIRKQGLTLKIDNLAEMKDEDLRLLASQITSLVEPMRAARKEAVAIGERNTDRYLTMAHLDVYVATSMRDLEDFRDQHDFTARLFSDSQIEPH